MSQSDARRARWRADLNDYGSAALRAAGFTAMADEHAAAAAEQRTYADLMVELAAAKAGNDPVFCAIRRSRSPPTARRSDCSAHHAPVSSTTSRSRLTPS